MARPPRGGSPPGNMGKYSTLFLGAATTPGHHAAAVGIHTSFTWHSDPDASRNTTPPTDPAHPSDSAHPAPAVQHSMHPAGDSAAVTVSAAQGNTAPGNAAHQRAGPHNAGLHGAVQHGTTQQHSEALGQGSPAQPGGTATAFLHGQGRRDSQGISPQPGGTASAVPAGQPRHSPQAAGNVAGAQTENAAAGAWPEQKQKASLQMLEEFLPKVKLPQAIKAASIDIVTAGKALQDWVAQRQDAYTELQAFKAKSAKCVEEMRSSGALSGDCAEVRPPPSWFCNRRAASEKMWELDEQLKRSHKSISLALKEAEEHEGPPSKPAPVMPGSLGAPGAPDSVKGSQVAGRMMPGDALVAACLAPGWPARHGGRRKALRSRSSHAASDRQCLRPHSHVAAGWAAFLSPAA